MKGFKALIPAAGEGRRLKPHTFTKPKVLLEVAGKPIIGHIMDRVAAAGPAEVCVVVSPGNAAVQDYLTGAYRCPMRFVVQREPLGLGDAVHQARACFNGEPVLIVLGDTIVDADLRRFAGGGSALAVKRVPDPRRFGVVELAARRITRLVEKPARPKSNLAVVGVYYFADSAKLFGALGRLKVRALKTRGEYQLTDAIQMMIDGGERISARRIDAWLDCGTPDALLATNQYVLRRAVPVRRPRLGTSVIVGAVCLAPDADVRRSVLGPDVSVGSGAQVYDSVIRDSIIHAGARIEHALLEHSIVGEKAVVTGTSRRANLGSYSTLHVG